ncbi:MAG TPA: hypothetical protein VJ965_11735 [Anaerolineales bacterium]|nr:hypothetical protein [Anaerolineales bacterium]
MSAVWLSSPALFVITLGFAGLLGELIYRLREAIQIRLAALAALFASLVLFPPLSLPGVLNWLLWLLALVVVVLFALRPDPLPSLFLTRRFALRYASAAMLLSAIWNVWTWPSFPSSLLVVSALAAACLAWLESTQDVLHP